MTPPEPARARPFPGAELATLVPMVGLAVLVGNDALLKVYWPGVVSGKLSNFAVMLYFPFLLTASWALLRAALDWPLGRLGLAPAWPGLTRRRLVVAMALTAFVHSAVNLSTDARDVYLRLLDLLDVFELQPSLGYVVDAPDVIGVVMMPVTWWWGNRLIGATGGPEGEKPRVRVADGAPDAAERP